MYEVLSQLSANPFILINSNRKAFFTRLKYLVLQGKEYINDKVEVQIVIFHLEQAHS